MINDQTIQNSSMSKDDLINLLENDAEFMSVMTIIKDLGLPNWCIFSGFVRNRVWDHVHGNDHPTPSTDIDIGFYDSQNKDLAQKLATQLKQLHPEYEWDINNFAFTHLDNSDEPYESLIDALNKELDTIMSVGVTVNEAGQTSIICPLGIDDLVGCIVRPTPIIYDHPERKQLIVDRLSQKRMFEKWPKMKVVI